MKIFTIANGASGRVRMVLMSLIVVGIPLFSNAVGAGLAVVYE